CAVALGDRVRLEAIRGARHAAARREEAAGDAAARADPLGSRRVRAGSVAAAGRGQPLRDRALLEDGLAPQNSRLRPARTPLPPVLIFWFALSDAVELTYLYSR